MDTGNERGEAEGSTARRSGRRRLTVLVSIAAIVIVAGGAATAGVALTRSHGASVASLIRALPPSATASASQLGGATPTAPDSSPPPTTRTTPSSHAPSSRHATPSGHATASSSPARTTSPVSPSSPSSTSTAATYLNIDSPGPRAVTEGDAFTCSISVSGGKAPYRWSPTGLPPGLVASPRGNALEISGVPTASGSFVVTASVTDSSSPAISENPEIPIYVGTRPMIVTVNAPSTAVFGQPYSGTVTVTGGDDSRYTWRTASVLPGLVLTPHGATLTISGAPNLYGSGPLVRGTVTDGESPAQTLTWVVDISIEAPPSS